MQNYSCPPKLRVRRLLKNEISSAYKIYAEAGRDYRFASEEQLLKIYENGVIWGAFEGGALDACTAVCRADSPADICTAAMKTRLFLPENTLMLPCAGGCDENILSSIFSCAALDADSLLIPVKSASNQLSSAFDAGFSLVAMRPLFELRPHYIFKRKSLDFKSPSVKMNIADTLSLSRALENGFTGVSLEQEYVIMK